MMMRTGRILLSGAWLCIVLNACNPSSDAPPGDAGAADGRAVPEWTFSAEPVVDIGGEDDGLFMALSAVRTRDGVVVANAGTGELRWFDGSGRPVRAAGRKGGGPGEFQHITWVGVLRGDSVAAWDPVLRRLSVFDAEGRFARVLPVAARGPLASVVGPLDDGSLLMATRTHVEPPRGTTVWRDSAVVVRVRLADGGMDTVGRFPGTEWFADASDGGRVQTRPFGRQAAAAVHGSTFYVGTGDAYEVGAYAADGTPRGRIRTPHEPMRVRAEDREAFLAEVVQVGGSEQDRQARTRMLAAAPFPETLPPYTSLAADADGNLWVRETQRPGATPEISRWSVFNANGERVATVRGPARFKAFQIGPDWILGTLTGDADAEHVRIYRIERS